jgi:hypothetical protein
MGEHSKMIVEENKERMAEEKESMEKKKAEIKQLMEEMRDKKKEIAENWKKSYTLLDLYKNSVFYRLKTECLDVKPDESIQRKVLENHPAMQRLENMKEWVEQEQTRHDQEHTVYKKGLENRIKLLQKEMKTTEEPVRKEKIREEMKDARTDIRGKAIQLKKTTAKLNKCRTTLRKQQKRAIMTVRKTAKKYLSQHKKERKALDKELKKINQMEKELDNQNPIEHLDEEIKAIINDHEGMIDKELKHLESDLEKEAIRKQREKEEEKERKQREKEEEKERKQREKEEEKERKQREKEAEKERKQREKDAEKERKQREKEAEKLAKKKK